MNCETDVSFANEEKTFAIIEDDCGTLKKFTTTSRIYTIAPVTFEQSQEFIPDDQVRASASQLSPIKGKKSIGSWSFDTYVKPSGTPGVAPEASVLFECGLGKRDINPGVSVVYSLANQLDSFSLYTLKGHTMFAIRGATVQTVKFNIAGNAIASINWAGNYMEQLWAGTCNASGSCPLGTTKIQLPAGHAALYRKDVYIQVGSDHNSNAGYLITDVNFGTNQITISPALGSNQGSGPEITPWYPTSVDEVGIPQHGKKGLVTIDQKDTIIDGAVVNLANNIKYYEDEKNNLWTAERFGRPKFRTVEGDIDLYFLKRGVSYYYRAEYQEDNALIIPAGNVAGYIMEIAIPYAEWKTPKISGTEEFKQAISFTARASASLNDEIEVTFK